MVRIGGGCTLAEKLTTKGVLSSRRASMVAVPVPGPKLAVTTPLPVLGSVSVAVDDSETGPVLDHRMVVPAGVPLSSAMTSIEAFDPMSALKLVGLCGERFLTTGADTLTV